jgi:hypothetical protein
MEKGSPTIPEEISGACRYVNKFGNKPECRDYHGTWTEEQVRQDCEDWEGQMAMGQACNIQEVLG